MFSRFKLLGLSLLSLAALMFFGCAGPLTPGPMTAPSEPAPLGDDLDADSLRTAVRYSLEYLQKLPPDRVVGVQPRRFTAQDIIASLKAFEKLLDDWRCAACFSRQFHARFELIPSSADSEFSQVLFTGYYQPVIDGSLVPTEKFRYPLYGRPPDLITAEEVTLDGPAKVEKVIGRAEGEQFLPYYTRREIDEAGLLRERGLEIAWVADPVELFFLHIQGSGIIRLADGRQLSVGYAAQNGWPYRSIGRLLIDGGKIAKEEMSMQRLRRYLNDHPREQSDILAYNESYVFFPREPGGSVGQPRSAGHRGSFDCDRLAIVPQRCACTDSNRNPRDRWRGSIGGLAANDTFCAQSRYRRRDSRLAAGGHLFRHGKPS